ncbi:MAG: hypothetical protein RJA21_1285 [Gemmatimonadota bacterium]|jgi:uncharacterized DUF497 family protein
MALLFEWDEKKAAENLSKHRVDFREAATVFQDNRSVTFPDEAHSTSERRYLIVGRSQSGRILVVSHTEVSEDVLRLISARTPTKRERRFYEEGESN